MRIAVTGAGGRLGRALVEALEESSVAGAGGPLAWGRGELDLDAPEAIEALLERDRPEVVVHAAAWTDVDGCARDPDLALRRNGDATGTIARSCARRGLDFLLVSTNEVFDGRRTDGAGYRPDDPAEPANPYGASKRAGELAAMDAYAGTAGQVAIVRTAWLFGRGKPDFPAKIVDAADRAAAAREPLRAVGDEWGTPTYTLDLADAIVEFLASGSLAGLHHVVNDGVTTRAAWARDILARVGRDDIEVVEVPSSAWPRASSPPRWGVLAATPLPSGEGLRPWSEAMAHRAAELVRARSARR